MIEMAYCGKEYHAGSSGAIYVCASEVDGYGDGACPSCLRAHIAKQDAAIEAARERIRELEVLFPTNRQLHENAAGMGLEDAFFRMNGIDPDARPGSSRGAGEGEVLVPMGLLDRLSLWFDWNRRVATEGLREEIDALRATKGEG